MLARKIRGGKNKIATEAVALEKAYQIVQWLMRRAAKFPKSQRHSLGQRIEDPSLDVLLGLVEANYSRSKETILRKVNLDLEKMWFLVRLRPGVFFAGA